MVVKRSSDAEREQCLRQLRSAYVSGRIDAGELERRAGRAAVAGTRLELALLTRDLPRTRAPAWARFLQRVDRALLRAHGVLFALANGALVGIWVLTGEGPFWPVWLLVPSTALLAWHVGGSWAMRRFLRRWTGVRSRPSRALPRP